MKYRHQHGARDADEARRDSEAGTTVREGIAAWHRGGEASVDMATTRIQVRGFVYEGGDSEGGAVRESRRRLGRVQGGGGG